MTRLRLAIVELLVAGVTVLTADRCLADAYVWIVIDAPSLFPAPDSTFTTDVKVSSWSGMVAAVDLVIGYDPAVVDLVDFSTPPDSDFYLNCSANAASFGSGQTRIACFRATAAASEDLGSVLGTLTWEAVGPAGSATDLTIELETVVGAEWEPLEVSTYGRRVFLAAERVYLPFLLRNH